LLWDGAVEKWGEGKERVWGGLGVFEVFLGKIFFR